MTPYSKESSAAEPLVALGGGVLQVAEVGGHAGDAQHAGLLVQDVQHLLDVIAVLVHQIFQDTGVDVAAAGAMGRPARGVKPMEVSTLLPPSMAVTEEPLPGGRR